MWSCCLNDQFKSQLLRMAHTHKKSLSWYSLYWWWNFISCQIIRNSLNCLWSLHVCVFAYCLLYLACSSLFMFKAWLKFYFSKWLFHLPLRVKYPTLGFLYLERIHLFYPLLQGTVVVCSLHFSFPPIRLWASREREGMSWSYLSMMSSTMSAN